MHFHFHFSLLRYDSNAGSISCSGAILALRCLRLWVGVSAVDWAVAISLLTKSMSSAIHVSCRSEYPAEPAADAVA
jgi:hypothetical protein